MTAVRGAGELMVSELFTTVQGEGPSLGRQATFLRLGVCNLHCVWCDTPYTWDSSRYTLSLEMIRRASGAVLSDILTTGTGRLVITGGEPLLQQRRGGWIHLTSVLHAQGWQIEVETNGTKAPTEQTAAVVDQFNVSPKLVHAGDPEAMRIVLPALKALQATEKAVFKFVCRVPDDLIEVDDLIHLAGLPPSTVWIMPEGTDAATLTARLRVLADPAIGRGYNVTTRLHVLAWGDERGK